MAKEKPNTTGTNFPIGENALSQKGIKICGMKYNTSQVAQLQPDYLGFIFYEKSPRHFEGDIPQLPKSIRKVGVFVDASLEYVMSKVKKHGLQAIQLHGQESAEYCLTLKRQLKQCQLGRSREPNDDVISGNKIDDQEVTKKYKTEIPARVYLERRRKAGMTKIIKAFSIKNHFDFSVLQPYEDVVDYYLFDTKGKLPGGNGYTFNWDVLKNYPSTKPYFLSGGIGLDEIDKLLSFLSRYESKHCHVIDINSKFEIKPGLKHIEDLVQFKKSLQGTF